jgi:hypothetical protein
LTLVARRCLIALCAVLVAEIGGLAVVTSGPTVTRGDNEPFRGLPPALAAAASQLGIPTPTVDRLQVRWGLPAGLHEPHPGFITAAYYGGHIYLRPTPRPADALAYEYLHDVWAHLIPQQRARLTSLLDGFYRENRGRLEATLDNLVKADVSNGATAVSARLDELHSIACSRTRDDHLLPELLSYCNQVLPGRKVTTKRF